MRLVFDLDGTLVDSAATLAAAANAMLAEFDRPPLTERQISGFVGDGIPKLVERVVAAGGGPEAQSPGDCLVRFRRIYDADPLTGTLVFPGVHQTLRTLAAAGHGLAVCTQKANRPTETILRGLGLMPPVALFTGGDSLEVMKPDAAMFLHAADRLPPGGAVMIGDSATDAATAQAAGVPFVFFACGYSTGIPDDPAPYAVFDDYLDLPGIIDRLSVAF
jgi:phosphoglycolate phosphatase